jgi:NTE family protein
MMAATLRALVRLRAPDRHTTSPRTMSPGPDTLIQSALERRNLLGLMAALPLLRDLSTDLLEEVAREVEWFSLPGGTTLFTAGDPVDGLYVVVNGALGVYVASPAGGARLAGEIAAGETAGEMEVISGKKRSATLISLRDTEVARLPVKTFEKLLASHPESLRHITNNLIERLESLQRADVPPHVKPKAFAIVPNGLDVDAAGFGLNLAEQLRRLGRAELVLSSQASDRTSHWFHRLERANDFVLYVSDPQPSNWTKLCLRQADSLLLLARCERAPRPWAALQAIREDPATAFAADIVLLHEGSKPSAHARGWLDVQPFRRHHHVRGPRDIARIARLLTGRALGVVLSGGGARGFAHIGAMRALEEAKLAVDAIGATSIGAIVGAAWAAGWSYEEMVERFRRSFVDSNPLGDYTLPLVSLVAGRRVGRLLNAAFGETHIEDLQLPYFCVSANLTTGQAAVHRRGRLSLWLRASAAIPGILPPVFTDKQIYVDGATINNLPVDLMREMMDGTVVAVDTGANRMLETSIEMAEMPWAWQIAAWFRRRRSPINILQILLRASMINSAAATVSQRALADLVLRPPLERIDLLDWQAFEHTIELGYRYASQALEKNKGVFSKLAPSAGGLRQGG